MFTLLAGAGFLTLAVTVLIGFEDANGILLAMSGVLLVAAPAAVLGRVALTHDLTREERRAWMRALFGRRALQAWSAYLRRSPLNDEGRRCR